MSEHAKLDSAEARKAYTLAGNARFTLVSTASGRRFTYRVRKCDDKPAAWEGLAARTHFVDLLVGPDNSADFSFMGTIFPQGYRHSSKSRVAADSQGAQAFAWFWAHPGSEAVEFWHLGQCGKCGRDLTDPESIAAGLGPICGGR